MNALHRLLHTFRKRLEVIVRKNSDLFQRQCCQSYRVLCIYIDGNILFVILQINEMFND